MRRAHLRRWRPRAARSTYRKYWPRMRPSGAALQLDPSHQLLSNVTFSAWEEIGHALFDPRGPGGLAWRPAHHPDRRRGSRERGRSSLRRREHHAGHHQLRDSPHPGVPVRGARCGGLRSPRALSPGRLEHRAPRHRDGSVGRWAPAPRRRHGDLRLRSRANGAFVRRSRHWPGRSRPARPHGAAQGARRWHPRPDRTDGGLRGPDAAGRTSASGRHQRDLP